MDLQLSQGYLESPSRKRPSPALVSDDSNDATSDSGYRSERKKYPKLDHHDSHNAPIQNQYESLDGVSSARRSLSDRGESQNSSPNSMLDIDIDGSTYYPDAMTDVVQENTEPTCCFGMVREMSMLAIHTS